MPKTSSLAAQPSLRPTGKGADPRSSQHTLPPQRADGLRNDFARSDPGQDATRIPSARSDPPSDPRRIARRQEPKGFVAWFLSLFGIGS
jgi:hypothetical protein